MRSRQLAIAVVGLAAVALLASACGSDAGTRPDVATSKGATTVDIDMADISFEPATLTVPTGEQVTFRFTNRGVITHDAFVGDTAAQADHEREMRAGRGVHHGGTAEEALALAPGETGILTHTFERTGTTEIGCHQPGHYAAGMKVDVAVV